MRCELTAVDKQALTTFRDTLQGHFAERLLDCRLFGSKARGEGTLASDLDVLVVIDDMQYQDKRWIITCGADVSLEYLVEMSPLALSPQQFNHLLQRERRLALDIEREGIPL